MSTAIGESVLPPGVLGFLLGIVTLIFMHLVNVSKKRRGDRDK